MAADTESKAEIPLNDAYPEVIPLRHPEQPQIESSESQAVPTHVVLPSSRASQDLVAVSAPEEPDLSAVPLSKMPNVSTTEEPAKVTEEPDKALVSKRYPSRIKRLIEEM